MALPIFSNSAQATAFGKYNFSTRPYYLASICGPAGSQPGPGEIYCAEKLGSPGNYSVSRDSPAQCSRTLNVVGTYDRNVALQCVRGWLSLNQMDYDFGIPIRATSLQASGDGAPIFECTIDYADPQRDDENVYGVFCEVSMTTTGGSASRESSLRTLMAVSAIGDYPPINYCRLLNVDNEGKANPVEVKSSTVHINVALNWPDELINEDYLLLLAELSPSINKTYWFGYAPGALLFEGATVDRVTCTDPYDQSRYYRWKINYSFIGEKNTVISEPVTYLNPTLTPQRSTIVVPKRGWDYLWRSYATVVYDGFPQTVLAQVNVEQMYDYVDFSSLGIAPSFFM